MKKSFFISFVISLGVFLLLSPVFIRLLTYLHPIVLVVVLCWIVLLVFFSVIFIRKHTLKLSYSIFLILMGLYTASLLVLLFFRPNDQTYHSWNLIPFSTIGFYLSGNVNWLISFYNLAANIGLFIPFGIFLMVNTSRSLMKLFLFPMMAIALIEVLQLITHRGSLDIDDLILNMLGIIVGYLFYPVFKRIVSIQR